MTIRFDSEINAHLRGRRRWLAVAGLTVLSAAIVPGAAIAAPPATAAPTTAPAAPPAPAAPGHWEAAPPPPPVSTDGCRDVITQNPTLDTALGALTFEGADGRRPLSKVEIVGLKTLDEKALWQVLGAQPAVIDAAGAAALLRRLAGLGLFASMTPVIDVRGERGPTLTIVVVEHPTVRKVVIEGLGEQKPEDLLKALLEAPSRKEVERHAEGKLQKRLIARAKAELARGDGESGKGDKDASPCLDPLPARDWVARSENDVVFPGIVWKGLTRGLDRVQGRLFDKGYEMASLTADLTADGTLTVRIDEGRIGKIDVAGVAPQIEDRVRAVVGIETGQPFVRSDLDGAVQRIKARFPFLRTKAEPRSTRSRPRIAQQAAAAGALHFASEEAPAATDSRWFTVQGGTVVMYFQARTWQDEFSGADLIRQTPVTSFAPGIEVTGRIWDPADRVHGRIDLGANVNTQRAQALDPTRGPPGLAPASWRFDWSAAGSVQVPALRLAELGILGYARVDTSDRWRLNRVDSYFNSILFNRADTDYFRRNGVTAFATLHFLERLTAGVEYRYDRYRSLQSVGDMFTVFNRDEAPPITAPVDDGHMGSVLLRLEWSSARAPLGQFGTLRRDPERSIVERPTTRAVWADARTMNTLEIADPALGGDDRFKFVRLVSDSAVFLRTGHDQGLKLRFRAAGHLGDGDLPLQKQESLGGWTALRGYGFKELRGGQFSLLGTAEYRLEAVSAFVDVGSLRTDGSFGQAKTGIGLALNFSDKAHLDFAWRTDDDARLRPEVRLLFHRAY